MEVGEIVAGKYRVDRVLGRGGMGVVVAADHIQLDQRVALKVLAPDAAREPSVRERFVREARASAQLRSEHVCRVSDVGALDDGSPYMVMELLDGCDLAAVIAHHGSLPVPIAVDYVLEACIGVAEAHALGVVHRDLKPANLFLAKRPDGTAVVKVLDFGIAKSQRQKDIASLTQTQAVLGSPGYMSPEQLRESRMVDVRSDVWSIGVILYELVSGLRPFGGETITEIALAVTLDPPPPLPTAIPGAFTAVVMRCLDKDPANRYPHLAALAAALAPFGREQSGELAASVARVLDAGVRAAGAVPGSGPVSLLPGSPGSRPGVSGRSDVRPQVSADLAPTVAPAAPISIAKPVTTRGFLQRHGLAAKIIGGLLVVTMIVVIAATRSSSTEDTYWRVPIAVAPPPVAVKAPPLVVAEPAPPAVVPTPAPPPVEKPATPPVARRQVRNVPVPRRDAKPASSSVPAVRSEAKRPPKKPAVLPQPSRSQGPEDLGASRF